MKFKPFSKKKEILTNFGNHIFKELLESVDSWLSEGNKKEEPLDEDIRCAVRIAGLVLYATHNHEFFERMVELLNGIKQKKPTLTGLMDNVAYYYAFFRCQKRANLIQKDNITELQKNLKILQEKTMEHYCKASTEDSLGFLKLRKTLEELDETLGFYVTAPIEQQNTDLTIKNIPKQTPLGKIHKIDCYSWWNQDDNCLKRMCKDVPKESSDQEIIKKILLHIQTELEKNTYWVLPIDYIRNNDSLELQIAVI